MQTDEQTPLFGEGKAAAADGVVVLRHIHWIPFVIDVIIVICFASTTIVYFSLGHHTFRGLPYLSDTGAHYPEGAIFACGLTLAALLIGILHVALFGVFEVLQRKSGASSKLPSWAMWTGLVGAFGLAGLAIMSEEYVTVGHEIGAVTFFFSTMVSFFLWMVAENRLSNAPSQWKNRKKARVGLIWASLLTMVVCMLPFRPLFGRGIVGHRCRVR